MAIVAGAVTKFGAAVIVVTSLAAMAQQASTAESGNSSWRAEMRLKAGSPKSCPPGLILFSFQLDDNRLTGTSPGGVPLDAPVAGDGTVTISYPGAAGSTTITGNARSRALEATVETLKGCRYTLDPVTGSAASAPALHDWALGRWSGNYFMAQYKHSAVLNVFRNSRQGFTCQLQILDWGGSATSDKCNISDEKIKFGSGIVEVELWRKTSNTLAGTHSTPGITRMQLTFTHE